MSNHAINLLVLHTDAGRSALEAVEAQVMNTQNAKPFLDLNRITPMPEELKVDVDRYTYWRLHYFCLRSGQNVPRVDDKVRSVLLSALRNAPRSVEEYEEHSGFGAAEYNKGGKVFHNLQKYGFPDWYEWRLKFWGTKQNALESDPAFHYWTSNDATIGFETAWEAPFQAICALSAMHPDISFKLDTIYEGGEDDTIATFRNGKRIMFRHEPGSLSER